MANGWTGGQYSLVRALTGAGAAAGVTVAAFQTASGLRALGTVAAGVLAAGAFAAGRSARTAALATAVVWLAARRPEAWAVEAAAVAVLALHACLEPAPYGSLDARDRLDPAGGWTMRAWQVALARAVLAAAAALFAWTSVDGLANPWRWTGSIAALALLALDPAWIPRRHPDAPDTLFYDGSCGLCHGAVRFALAEDAGGALRFAPLDSDAFRAAVPADVRAALPDSLVVATADGRVLTRSAAVLHVGARLGGFWRALAALAAVLPQGLRDRAYDGVARARHRLFARPQEACPMLPPHLRTRFLH